MRQCLIARRLAELIGLGSGGEQHWGYVLKGKLTSARLNQSTGRLPFTDPGQIHSRKTADRDCHSSRLSGSGATQLETIPPELDQPSRATAPRYALRPVALNGACQVWLCDWLSSG